jgi:spermidine synthase
MHSTELIDTAEIPGGGQLRLMRYGPEFSIEFGEDELMGSQAPQSEQALADLAACRTLGRQDRVLIGGLGMGFTLGAALSAFSPHTRIVVAELVPQVVEWARGPLAHLFSDYLSDPRVTIAVRDVHDVIAGTPGGFDAILLDVDNGPDGFIHPANDRLYCNWGLRDAYAALRPGGVLAIWSAYPDDDFVARLERVGFAVEETSIPDAGNAERSPYTIWLATRAEAVAEEVLAA